MTPRWQDLLALAVKMEEEGRDFYNRQAARAKDEKAAEIFRLLAEEEAEHAALFSRGLPEQPPQEVPADSAEVAYLTALGRSSFFQASEEALGDPKLALTIGVEAEKEAILFYSELAALAKDPETRRILHDLLRQEKMHLVELRERLYEDWS